MTPLTQTKLLSFKDNFKELVNLSLRNKLPNKLIFSGHKGIGKSTFAFHLINYLFSKDEEGSYNLEDNEININNKSYKLVSNNTHPNLLLYKAITMSSAFPFVFKPIEYNGEYYIDGGLCNNFPLNACLNEVSCEKDEILAINYSKKEDDENYVINNNINVINYTIKIAS